MKQIIQTDRAPTAIGCYSQAVRTGNTVYLSGQIPLDPSSMTVVVGTIDDQIVQVFKNLKNVAEAAGGTLDSIVKMTVFLTSIDYLANVNAIMPEFFKQPYPARTSIAIVGLPKGVDVEIEAIMEIN